MTDNTTNCVRVLSGVTSPRVRGPCRCPADSQAHCTLRMLAHIAGSEQDTMQKPKLSLRQETVPSGAAPPSPPSARLDPRQSGRRPELAEKVRSPTRLRCKAQRGWGGSAHYPDPTAQSATQTRRRTQRARRQGRQTLSGTETASGTGQWGLPGGQKGRGEGGWQEGCLGLVVCALPPVGGAYR